MNMNNKVKSIDSNKTNNVFGLNKSCRIEFNVIGDEHRIFNNVPPLSNKLFRSVSSTCDDEIFFRCFAKKFHDETLKDKINSTKMLLRLAGLENIGIDVTYKNDGFSETVKCKNIDFVYDRILEIMKPEFFNYDFKYKIITVDEKVRVEQDLYRLLSRMDSLLYTFREKNKKLFSLSDIENDSKGYNVIRMINHIYEELYGEKFTRNISVFIETDERKRTMFVPMYDLERCINNEICRVVNGTNKVNSKWI